MLYYKPFIIIVLLICCIIGLVIISNYKQEHFNSNSANAITTSTPSDYDNNDLMWYSNKIAANNELIDLLTTNAKTGITIPLIKSDAIQKEYTNNIQYGLNTLLNNSYNSYSSDTNMINGRVKTLEDTIIDLENTINNLDLNEVNTKTYNKIKSLNNGLDIQLVNTPNTLIKDDKTGNTITGYMVMANDGCLSVGANDYDIYKCDDKNIKQIFKMEHILNETAYQNNIDMSLPVDNIDKTNINYPFAMLKSVNNENCLTNSHGSLSVQPCYSFIAQRWFPL